MCMHAYLCVCEFAWGRTSVAGLRSLLPIFYSGQPSNTSILPSLTPPHPLSSLSLFLSLFAHNPVVDTGWPEWRYSQTHTRSHTHTHTAPQGHPGTNTALSACPLSFALCQLMTRSNFTWQSWRQHEASQDVTVMTFLARRRSFLIKNLTNPQQLPLYFVNELLIWNNALANIVRADWPYQGHAILLYTVSAR